MQAMLQDLCLSLACLFQQGWFKTVARQASQAVRRVCFLLTAEVRDG